MLILQDILSQEIVQRLGWTLLHFIWQAAAVALILTIILRVLRKSTANLRYIFACLALVIIVLLPIITMKLVPVSQPLTTAHFAPAPVPAVLPIEEMSAPETIVIAKPSQPQSVTMVPAIPLKQRAVNTLEPALPYIVSGWLIGVFGLSIWHLGGWTQLQRLKRIMVKQVDSTLQSKLKVLARKLKVRQTVRFMESALVQIPTVVGWLKPVILLPASAITGLSTEQLKAIVAHELAHIKRFDYLINILQTVIEILGFYHPAVWWVSHKIRAERENCCDDVAVSISGDRLSYAGALASMEEIRASRGKLAVAATGGNLFRRICRLLGKDSTEKTGLSWVPATTAILLIIALAIPTTLALTNKPDSTLTETKTEVPVEDDSSEETASQQLSFGQAVEGVQVRLRGYQTIWKAGQVVKLKVDLLSDKEREFPHYGPPLDVFEVMIDERWYQRASNFFAGLRSVAPSPAKHRDGLYFGFRPQDWRQKSNGHLMELIPGKHVLRVAFPFASNEGKQAQQHRAISNPVEIEILPTEENDVPVEDDISIATAQIEESPASDISPAPVLAKSPAPTDKDKSHVQVECFVVEVSFDSKIDTETLKEAEKILGNKVSLRNTKANVILRHAAKATAPAKNKSEDNKRITDRQFKTFIDTLTSKGYIKILMNPMIETLNGKTATVISSQKVPLAQAIKATPDGGKIIKITNENEYVDVVDSIEITPHVFEDGDIILEVEADLGSPKLPPSEASKIPVSTRKLSTQVRAKPGESLVIGGLTENPPAPENNINNTEKQANEVLFILTPTIVKPDNDSEKKAELAHKLKLLGLAVAMYADDNNDDLPGSIQDLKPYMRNEQDFDWILDNVEYFDKGKTAQRNAAFIPIAYDKTMLEKADGTNVLFLDFSARFVDTKEFEKLDLQRAKFRIETWFLAVTEDFLENINHNADSPDEAKELLKLKSELLAAADGSNQMSFIHPKHNVNLLLKAVRAHKDSKIFAAPQVLCLEDKTAEINVMNFETYYIVGYTEPNDPSEKPQPILESVEEGISMSLKPRLTPNKDIDMQFESDVTNILDSEERKFKGKAPYKPPKVQRRTQSTRYIAKDGDTLLFGGNKIADSRDDRTERKELLILIKASTIGSSKQDKPAQAKRPAVVKPSRRTSKANIPTATTPRRRVRPKDSEFTKTKPATASTGPDESAEPNEPMVTVNFKNVEMKTIIKKLSEWTGKIIIPTADSMNQKLTIYSPEKLPRSKALSKIYSALRIKGYIAEQTDGTIFLKPIPETKLGEVPTISEDYPLSMVENKDQVVQKFFKLKYYSPSQMAQIILPLVGKYGYVSADETKGTLLVIDTVKSLMRIETIIEQFDAPKADQIVQKSFKLKYRSPSQIAKILGPLLTKNGHVSADENTGILLVIDMPENLNRIEKIIAAFDLLKADLIIQKLFKLQHHDVSEIARIVRPVLTKTGHVSADERTNSLLVIDTVENLKRIEKIIEQYDVPKAKQTVTEIFEIHNGDPVEIVEVLKKLINGRHDTTSVIKPDTASVIESSNGPILLIPEPQRKWIIAKASPENMKQIGQWIKKLDINKSTMGLDPIDATVHKQLETIVDLSELAPQMSFGEVVEILENSVEPPLQIQPIWKDLLENAEVEQATPASMDPLTGIKLRKALEILLTSVSSTGMPKLTYIVDEGVILIGTADVLPPKKVHHIDDTSDLIGTDAAKTTRENMLKIAEQTKEWDVPRDVDKVKPRIIELKNSDAEQMVELLKSLFTKEGEGALNIQDILIDRGIKVNQKIVRPLYEQLIFEEVPGTNKLIVISKIPEAYDVIEEFIFDLDRQNVSPENIKQIIQSIDKHVTRTTIGIDPIDKAVYEQLETIIDLSDLGPATSFGEVIEKLENSVSPPLQIQPIWKDLLDNAEIEQVTPASMDPLMGIKLSKALEILIASATSSQPGEFGEITYVVDDGVILIGSKDLLPHKMLHCVYDISDLVEDAADANNLIRSITETIEPESWFVLSDTGEGTIIPYPLKQPKNFAVLQTYKIHLQIKRFLNDMRSSRSEMEQIDKLPDESEEPMTPLEQIQKQLDELIKQRQATKATEPNKPPAPKAKLISNTFIDCPLRDALKSIAAAANVNIMTDGTIKGIISCTLKDVTVETALDIVLAGTPYLWKKTPDCYMVASRLELSKMVHRVYDISDLVSEPANYRMSGSRSMKMDGMGSMMDSQGGYTRAQSLVELIQETIEPDSWCDLSDTGEGTIMAYPMQSPRKLAVMQTHEVHQEIEKLLNAKRESLENQVSIETVFLSVSEDYLKDVGLDANTENFSDGWTRHLAAKYPAGPNGQPYGLIIDDLHVTFLLRAVQAHHDSKALVAPRVRTRASTTADTGILEEYRYIKSYNEPNSPSDEPQPKRDKVKLGPHMWLTPKLTDNNRNVNLDLKLELRQLEGIIEGKYKGKYPYYKPIIDVISAKMPCTIPEGKTMLIGGLKIIEQIKKEQGAPGLKDLPLIGAAFRSKDNSREQKMLLILVKPSINSEQKATKLRPGREDSEEHIKRLAEQLDKKINPSGKPE